MGNTLIPWPAANSTKRKKLYKFMDTHADEILGGTVISIDPASISLGWAIHLQGELYLSGTITADKGDDAPTRLRSMQTLLTELEEIYAPDYLLIEEVRQPAGSVQLVWSVGAVFACIGAPVLEIPINLHQTWSKKMLPDYKKSDHGDAENIGESVMAYCRESKIWRKNT